MPWATRALQACTDLMLWDFSLQDCASDSIRTLPGTLGFFKLTAGTRVKEVRGPGRFDRGQEGRVVLLKPFNGGVLLRLSSGGVYVVVLG
jgi:hypothetical protein